MIETIINIKPISSLDGFYLSDLNSLDSIDFDSEPKHEGGFGNIYSITQTNLVSDDKILLKIFQDEEKADHGIASIKGLHDKLKRRTKSTGIHYLNEVPELLGLPFMIFEGYNEISQEIVKGLLVLNLNELGYFDFGLDETDHPYSEIEFEDRFIYAYQLVRIVSFLEELKFIHSDLKEDAIWINPNSQQLALIDYDSGYHHDLQLKPSTIGALNQWASKHWRRLIKDPTLNDETTTRDRISNEHWVLANALFQIIYTAVPYFFLKDANPETKEEYLEQNRWPHINLQSDLANNELRESYQGALELLKAISESLGPTLNETFEKTFNEGFSKKISQRPAPGIWKKTLLEINQKLENEPSTREFDIDRKEIQSEFDDVKISFELSNYNSLRINGIAQKFRDLNATINLKEDGIIDISVENDFANVAKEIKLKVSKKAPRILTLSASENERTSLEPIVLAWKTENCHRVEVSLLNEQDLPSNHSISVYPQKSTEYKLIAYGSFGQSITEIIRVEVPAPQIIDFNYEINIEKGIQNIDLHWSTDNTTHCEISPFVGKENSNGSKSLDIIEKTQFKLVAYGYFGETSAEIVAVPFPKPVIEKLLVTSPKIELETNIETTPLQLGLNNSIEFKVPSRIFEELNVEVPPPIRTGSIGTFC